MPVQAIAASTSESTAGDLKQFYLDKIFQEIRNAPNVIDDLSGSDLSDVEDTAEAIRDGSLIEYRELVEKTRDLRLDKLIRVRPARFKYSHKGGYSMICFDCCRRRKDVAYLMNYVSGLT